MLIEINEIDMKEFLEWANGRAFCNSGQHVCDRIATIFEGSSLQQATPAEDRYGRQLGAVKPLVQYLYDYIEHEVEIGNIFRCMAGYNWQALLEQALDAYESTQGVQIKIERNV